MSDLKEKYQVCVVTGTRAEYGLLRPLLFRLKDNQEIDLRVVITGSHLSNIFGNTQQEIVRDGFTSCVTLPIPIEDDSKEGMAVSTGVAITKFANLFASYRPELVVVLGDRFEIFAAVSAAHLMGVSVAHISGGDITEGAVDDAIRHCLTKMSCLHFPGCEQSAKRVIQMGEQPDTVFNVGELGVENCKKMQLIERDKLATELEFNDVNGRYAVVTFHPVTLENNTGLQQVKELVKAMDALEDMSYIITMANADAGGREINDFWLAESKKRNNWKVTYSLGVVRYLSAVKYAQMVIGNSSSGVIEVPALGIPTVNIGNRQKGRMISESVICCEPISEQILQAMKNADTNDFKIKSRGVMSPFGDGTTSKRIEEHIIRFLHKEKDGLEKHFYDIDF